MDQKQSETRSTRSTSAYNSNGPVKDYASVIQKPLKKQQSEYQPESQLCSNILINILNGNQKEAMSICNLLGKSDLKPRIIEFTQQYFSSINRKDNISNKENSKKINRLLLKMSEEQKVYTQADILKQDIQNIDYELLRKVMKITNQSKVFGMMMQDRNRLNTFILKEGFVGQKFITRFNQLKRLLMNQESPHMLQQIAKLQDDILKEIDKLNLKRDLLIKQNKQLVISIESHKTVLQKIGSSINQQMDEANHLKESIRKMRQVQGNDKQTKITLLTNQLKEKQQAIQTLSAKMKQKENQINFNKAIIQHEQQEKIRLNEKNEIQKFKLLRQLNKEQIQIQEWKKNDEDKQNQLQNLRHQLQRLKQEMKQREKRRLPTQMEKSFETNSQSNNLFNFGIENSRLEESFVERDISRELNISKIKQRQSESRIFNIQKQLHHQRQKANTTISEQQQKINQISAKNGILEYQLEQQKQKYEELNSNYNNILKKIQGLEKILQQSQQELHRANQELKQTKEDIRHYQQQLDLAKAKMKELQIKDRKESSLLLQDKSIISQSTTGKATSTEIAIYMRDYLKRLSNPERNQLQQKLKKII